jgi:hypothetical protein
VKILGKILWRLYMWGVRLEWWLDGKPEVK